MRGMPSAAGLPRVQMRFVAIWLALVALIVLGGIVAPRSLLPSTFLAIIPLAAFLPSPRSGESLVLMSRGIDLSIPAIVTLSSTFAARLLRRPRRRTSWPRSSLRCCLRHRDRPDQRHPGRHAQAQRADRDARRRRDHYRRHALVQAGRCRRNRRAASARRLGRHTLARVNVAVWVAALLVAILSFILRKTTFGRRFSAVGANPRAA